MALSFLRYLSCQGFSLGPRDDTVARGPLGLAQQLVIIAKALEAKTFHKARKVARAFPA